MANVDGVHQMTLVLDGQQRLTSILIGLKGTYKKKPKSKRRDDPAAWTKQRLYLNLLKDPNSDDKGDSEIYYQLQFFDEQPGDSLNEKWFRLGKILDFDREADFYLFSAKEKENLPVNITENQKIIFETNLGRLYRAVWKDEVVSYYTEVEQDYDKVLDIFVRANDGGLKLSKSDLLLSLMTSNWGNMNAREEVNNFVDHLNKGLDVRNNLDKDFVMKSCLVLSDLPVEYKVGNFEPNLTLIKEKWDKIQTAIEKGVMASNSYGIDRDNLTSENALIPICYYLFRHPEVKLTGDSSSDVKNSRSVRNWLITSLLNNVFGGSSDSMLTSIRNALKSEIDGSNFPISEINSIIEKSGRSAYFDDNAIADYLSNKYNGQLTFLALSILYQDYK